MLTLSETLSLGHSLLRSRAQRRTSTPLLLPAKKKKKASSGKKRAAGGGGFGTAKPAETAYERTPEQLQWRGFMEWVADSGGSVDKVRLANCGGGLRGVKATCDVAKGEEIVRIPRTIVLDVERAEASPVSGVWRDGDTPADLPRYVKIALALLYEQRRGAESVLRPYLEMLPSAADFMQDGGPAGMWSDEELALTECGKLMDAARRRRQQSYGDGHPAVQPANLAACWERLALPGAAPSAEELAWAVTAVTSRTFGVGAPATGGAAPASAGLVPVVDMFNTDGRPSPHTAKRLDKSGKSFTVYATRAIKRGSQVCLSYGDLANVDLLSQFGFVLPELGAPPDVGFVDCTVFLEERLNAAGGAERLAQLAADELLLTDADGTASRWQAAGQRLQAAVLRLTEDAPPDGSSADAALVTYTGLLQRTLSAFSTTAAEDRAALGLGDSTTASGDAGSAEAMTPRTRLALQFRLLQKLMLERAAAAAVKDGASGISRAAAAFARPQAEEDGGSFDFDFSLTELKPAPRK